ncbi:type II secretion system secretin GspD [Halarcobacter bivalviorum]|uniref:Type II secretion system protein GspD n=1 Tax=Halarcobacter bivalviorum TaxID=663364 RepID=A0AAX2AAX3_9BACT|nr:type II secretion system secretin GspD [Halarcobacter bivalviorum]AXH12179.1 type II secretion/transformation system, D protein [Halarcobacter bivalviorum]RXK11283.1 type II secretion system protein GspD [Halarcobacter bivalviorum]
MKQIKIIFLMILLNFFAYGNEEKININFKDLEIIDLVKITSKVINKNILLTDEINGNVDFISNKPLNKNELVKILIYVLENKGYTLINNGSILRIVKLNESAKNNVPVTTSNLKTNYNQIITEVFKVNNANVDYIASRIRHLISKEAKLVTNKESNTIVLTDFQDNIKTVKKILNIMTVGAKKTMLTIKLTNMIVTDTKKNLDEIKKAIFDEKIETEKVEIIANKENNSLVLIGNKKNTNYLKDYIKNLDRNDSLRKRIVNVYALKNIEAKNVIKIVDDIVGKKTYLDPNDKPLASIDEETNSIILMGPSNELKFIKILLTQLDRDKAQVYVQAKIIELSDSLLDEIGIKYGIFGGKTNNSGIGTFASSLNGGNAFAFEYSDIGLEIPDLTSGLALGASISLLNQDGALDIVSEPSILALNNKESSIYVGETISIKTSSTTTDGGNTNDNYQREDVGLTLKVKPRVSNDNKVMLDINTILEDVKTTQTNSGNADTSKKEIKTTAIVNNGESVILGGLIQDKDESTISKIPILGDIPILGNIFKHKKMNTSKKSLVVIVTPYIIPKSKDLTYIRNQLAELKILEGKYLRQSLIRLKEKQLKQKENDKEYKKKVDKLDKELNSSKEEKIKNFNQQTSIQKYDLMMKKLGY